MKLKIVSWNIWVDCDFAKVKDFLREADADIACLQEVKNDDTERDIISYMQTLGYTHVFASVTVFFGDEPHNFGPAIFSKYPIKKSDIYHLSEIDDRAMVQADIEVNNTILHVFTTHLLHTHQQSSLIQEAQATALLQVLPAERVLVMGDFNATPESITIQKIKNVLTDTAPSSLPTLHPDFFDCKVCDKKSVLTSCLDYIFTSKDISAHSFCVHPALGSDHLPVSVIVNL